MTRLALFRLLTWLVIAGVIAGATLFTRRHPDQRTVVRIAFAAILVALVARSSLRQGRLVVLAPPIHDISTDIADPPAFVAIAPLRARAPNPAAYDGPAVGAKQREAYPEIQPIRIAGGAAEAWRRALRAAELMGWELVAVSEADGRIEATATTFLMGFKDDIVIRVRAAAEGAIVDVRSKSRLGESDLGTNAARIRQFAERLAAAH